jgi:hypothetical protein
MIKKLLSNRINPLSTAEKLFCLLPGIILFLGLFSGCYYDSEEFLYPEINPQCDTTNVTYSGSVQSVLLSYCLSCHSNTTASALGGNIKLEDYSDVKGLADNGRLVGAIQHDPGYSAMPKGENKLNDCTVSTFRIWIANGAPNN